MLGELGVVAGDQFGEVGAEEPLERACSPLTVGARGRRIQREGELDGHGKEYGPQKRAACSLCRG